MPTDPATVSVRVAGLTVVVPAYRSGNNLARLIDRLKPVLTDCADQFEVVIVCDDALEETWSSVCELSAQDASIVGIRLMRNYGQHNALLCGIRKARFPITVTLDDDLQHPPEAIPILLRELETGQHDVVYGAPLRERHTLRRNLASRAVKWVLMVTMGVANARDASAFRAFRTHLRSAFDQHSGSFVSIDVLLSWASTSFSSVQVEHSEREHGQSGYSNRKLLTHAVNMLTGFSALPLRIASVIGLSFTVFGFFVLVWVVGRYLIQGTSVAGFPFLASIVAIFSGAQLACLGIIGEYLARMHFRSMGRPAYAVSETTDSPSFAGGTGSSTE